MRGLDEREPGELVAAVERQRGEDPPREVGGPDAVAGEAVHVVDPPVRQRPDLREVDRRDVDGPPHAPAIAAAAKRGEVGEQVGVDAPRDLGVFVIRPPSRAP